MNEYTPSTILPPLAGTTKFGGTQSRIIMGGVNVQNVGTQHIPCIEIRSGETVLQYGLQSSDDVVSRVNTPNTDLFEIGKTYSLLNDNALPSGTVVATGVTGDPITYDAETGILTGVSVDPFASGTAYWCHDIITLPVAASDDNTDAPVIILYLYTPTTAGRTIKEVWEQTNPIANEYTAGKQQMVNALVSCGISATMSDTLTELADKMVQAVGIINTATYSEQLPFSIGDLLFGKSIKRVDGREVINGNNILTNLITNVEYIGLPNFTIGNIVDRRQSLNSLICLQIPSYVGNIHLVLNNSTVGSGNYAQNSFNKLRHVIGGTFFDYTNGNYLTKIPLLYDILPQRFITSSANYRSWGYNLGSTPEFLLTSSSSICNHDEWDDANEPEGGFANNLEKAMWYFEHHFIPYIAEVTTSQTLTLSSPLYSAISAAYSTEQPTKTLLEVLTDKGWTVASSV